jgi:hypothetical protein
MKRSTKGQGCVVLLVFISILYACASNGFSSPNNNSIAEGQTLTASSPRVVLPTGTATELAALTLLPTTTPAESDTTPAPSGVWGVVTTAVLNVRSSPDVAAELLGTLQAGECVELVSEMEGWYGVATENVGGWSSADFISPVMTCPTADTVVEVVAESIETVANESPSPSAEQVVAVNNTLPSYVGQPFAPNMAVVRDGWLYECFGQGNNGLREVSAGTPVQLLGVGEFAPSADQQATLGSGPFYKVRIWDGQFGWLPSGVMDADPLAYGAVPGDCAEYDSIDWTTVVRAEPPTAEPTLAPVPEWTRVVATPTSASPTPSWTPNTNPPAVHQSCCKICTTGKACGNSCISRSYTCRKGPGCACNG